MTGKISTETFKKIQQEEQLKLQQVQKNYVPPQFVPKSMPQNYSKLKTLAEIAKNKDRTFTEEQLVKQRKASGWKDNYPSERSREELFGSLFVF